MSTIDQIIEAAVREEERKLSAIRAEIEELRKEKIRIDQEKNKEIDKRELELTRRISAFEQSMISRETKILSKEKELNARERELDVIRKDISDLKRMQESFEAEKDRVDGIRIESLEKMKEAEDTKKLFDEKIKELVNAKA